MNCPICEKRPVKRFCPAKGERICPVCCGTYREITMDCPSDCPHLVSARRYEAEHRKSVEPRAIPFPDVEYSSEVLRRNQELLSGIGVTILTFAQQNASLRDPEVLSALEALGESYRTLQSGIYFERPPDAPLPRALYISLTEYLQKFKEQKVQETRFSTVKDSDIFRIVVYILRVASSYANGRPRSRAFLDFLRGELPEFASASHSDQSRIILP